MQYARPMPLPSYPYGIASQGGLVPPGRMQQSTGPQKHLHGTAARCRGRAGVSWPMGLYEPLPKVASSSVHFGRLPSDLSEARDDIYRSQHLPKGCSHFHGESSTIVTRKGGPHDARGGESASAPADISMRTICNRSKRFQGARWDSGPGLQGCLDEQMAQTVPTRSMSQMDTWNSQFSDRSAFAPMGDTGELLGTGGPPKNGRRSDRGRRSESTPLSRGHQTPGPTPGRSMEELLAEGPRVCKPGMEGLGINLTLGSCKWEELMSTKARRNALGASRSAWNILESNFEAEARDQREQQALANAKSRVRRASIIAMNGQDPVSNLPGGRQRRDSLGGALEMLYEVENYGAKGKSSKVEIEQTQDGIPFGQASSLYGRGMFSEGFQEEGSSGKKNGIKKSSDMIRG